MITIKKLEEIIDIIAEYKDIEYRIINNTVGKNLILLNKTNDELQKKLTKYKKYIQEIILESDEDDFFINDIKSICTEKNTFVHRNISYIDWNRKSTVKRIKNVIAGYSFKGGMGRSTTLAYLSYFYYLMGKKIVVIDSDFEAPGISSMFFTQKERSKRAGVLDYLIDLHIEDKLKLDDYYLKFIDKDNEKTGSLYLFPSGIDYYTNNYINKISKIDFNSQTYTNNFTKLIDNINDTIKPDLIFIDLRAGINESNGFILKSMSNMIFLFFNSEEQNKDGLTVILNSLEDMKNYHIVNSTIRHYSAEVRKIEENKFEKFMDTLKKDIKLLKIKWLPELAKDDIIGFVDSQYQLSNNTSSDFEMQNIIKTISKEYFYGEQEIKIKPILEKLEKEFSKLIAQQKFENEEDLKYFYFKSDITEIVNDQVFLILGAKGTGKSAFFEIFTKNYKEILERLETKNNVYIEGFSKKSKRKY
jgi:MinD-like ATPase involved in chromosome partitioning or flagellar assembly